MATAVADQTERAFQKQPTIHIGAKSILRSKDKNRIPRYIKSVGLGFKTPKEAIEVRAAWGHMVTCSACRGGQRGIACIGGGHAWVLELFGCGVAAADISAHRRAPTLTRSAPGPATCPSAARSSAAWSAPQRCSGEPTFRVLC